MSYVGGSTATRIARNSEPYRHRRTVDESVVLEGLQEVLRPRKTTPAAVARYAERGRIAPVILPYLEALTTNA